MRITTIVDLDAASVLRTVAAEYEHPDGELGEQRGAALADRLIDDRRGVRLDLGALLAWIAIGTALTLMVVLVILHIVKWLG